ncbi:zinc-binding dehydrogenase [Actinomycetospora cinnamomea]|uniref:NADPH:quinone reductase-like Zn-dependent oxidoreductase n=1 Tax=Actinomycetospora cinnamomea TaxID=663609 RepID=A0A2U1FFY6_9PSEU|nr:zinc-binding dehydrogenase [Actinomycetospora cinnamomea]PVZ11069.1 NADPH:quinone reductase-like Zn-dependent oxidoreductase [Actinomycetospora cinnamomea]
MRVVRVEEFGGPEVLRPAAVADVEPGPGEAAIAVAAADVMFLDTLLRSGWGEDFFPVAPPYVPGSGVGGRVIAGPWTGRRVVADTKQVVGGAEIPVGGYVERAVVPETELIPVPDALDVQQAVALLHDGPTLQSLLDAVAAEPGRRVLVAAAAGGAGVLLVQELTRRGVEVVGAARGRAKIDLVRSLGAVEVVDYGEDGWTDRVGMVDAVLDGAGAALGRAAFALVRDGGRFVSYGTAGGEFASPDLEEARRRAVAVIGLTDLPRLDRARRRALVERTLVEAARGHYRPVIGQTFALEKASDAHAAIAARETVGKTLLLP